MSKATQQQKLNKIRAKTVADFGPRAASIGNEKYDLNVVPTPSLMLDYKLGTGGFPYGSAVEVFGGNGLGKTTVLGYGVLANVQREGKLPALLAMEPHAGYDRTIEWAQKLHGLDPDLILVQFPDNVQEAFDMLYDLIYNTEIDYIMIDSIGAMGHESGQTDSGSRKKAYGVSGEVTAGLNLIMPRLWKANKGLMIINQVRQAGQGTGGVWHESPGGEALKHHASVRIHLKPGSGKYYEKIQGEKVLVGRELKCAFKKNRLAQATNKSAEFDFYNIETERYGIGIDKAADLINTAKVSGVFKVNGGWLTNPIFPKGQVQGAARARKFLDDNPEAYDVVREEVLNQMLRNEIAATTEEDGTERDEQAAVS